MLHVSFTLHIRISLIWRQVVWQDHVHTDCHAHCTQTRSSSISLILRCTQCSYIRFRICTYMYKYIEEICVHLVRTVRIYSSWHSVAPNICSESQWTSNAHRINSNHHDQDHGQWTWNFSNNLPSVERCAWFFFCWKLALTLVLNCGCQSPMSPTLLIRILQKYRSIGMPMSLYKVQELCPFEAAHAKWLEMWFQ